MILIIFGSRSDSRIYKPLLRMLDEKGISNNFFIASAHKALKYLDKILEEVDNYRLIIAGAGLAAHLPGVIASKTIRPVIGIPVDVNFRGLDSLLSIMQMPPGVPVLSTGVDGYGQAAKIAGMKRADKVNIVKTIDIPEKTISILESFGIEHRFSEKPESGFINIVPAVLEQELRDDVPIINVPLTDNLSGLERCTKTGLWVGVNRFENAALAAVQLANHERRYDKRWVQYKNMMEDKFAQD